MRIALGADHRGSDAVNRLSDALSHQGHETKIHGSTSGEPCDYPEVANMVASAIANGEADRGVLICGTGVGMCITANKIAGVRAATVHDELTAQLSRSHNDANIVCLSADLLGQHLIEKIAGVFMSTDFEGGRHARRVHKISAIERGEDPASVTE